MERLTGWDGDRAYICNLPPFEIEVVAHDFIRAAVERLAAYEDTGLEPDSIEEAKEAVGRAAIELAYYHKAEQEGRLLVLPCKVGDTVYWIKGKAILEVYIQWFETNAYGWCACGTYPPMATPTFRFADFGKTVFLTREEAEATLEKEGASDGLGQRQR